MKAQRKCVIYIGVLLSMFLTAFLLYHKNSREVALTVGVFSDSNWGASDEHNMKIFDFACQKYRTLRPEVQINYEPGIQKEDYSEWLGGKFLCGEEPDICLLPANLFYLLASKDALLNLRPYMEKDESFHEEDFYESAVLAGEYEGEPFALPYETVPLLMCVNTSILEEKEIEIPDNNWTWEDFHGICRKVTRDYDKDGLPEQFGVYRYTWKNALYSNGVTLFNEQGSKNNIGSRKAIGAVNFVYRMGSLTQGYVVTEKDFEDGKVAFSPMLLTDYRTYKSSPHGINHYSNFEWTCIPMPAGPAGDNITETETLMVAISRRSRNKKEAWEFVKILTSDTQVQRMVIQETKGISPIREIAEDISAYGGEEIDVGLISDVMEKAVAIHRFYKYEEAVSMMDEGVEAAMNGNESMESALRSLQREIDNYLNNG